MDEEGKVLDAYYLWREKGMKNPQVVRYPVGYSAERRAKCKFAFVDDPDEKLEGFWKEELIFLSWKLMARVQSHWIITKRLMECLMILSRMILFL
jgi:hypothetical protein